jgi:hypothetical protein
VFPRIAGHPVLAGIDAENLHDWCGEATLMPPRLEYKLRPRYGPTIEWAGLQVPQVWRCGTRGNVASVLIEKPARGDFLPIVDGGFSLQYSPLMEYREGKGMVMVCQLDVTGRTENDPAGLSLARNLLGYISDWKPTPRREAVYAGAPEGKAFLESLGIAVKEFEGRALSKETICLFGPGAGTAVASEA